MDHTLKQMRMFVKVAEMGSFTKASLALNQPKAALSLGIAKLEAHLGTRLLHRTTRAVQLTQDGMFFLERCQLLLSEMEEVETMFHQDKNQIKGFLKVDVPSRIARLILIPELPKFYKQYPDLRLELCSTDRAVDLIQEGIDCVIRVGNLSDSSMIVRSIGQLEIINCASATYLKRYGQPKKLSDLKKHLLINYSFGQHEQSALFEYSSKSQTHTLKMKSLITVNNVESYIATAMQGLGIIQVPSYDVREELKKGSLIQVLPEYKSLPMQISFLYPHKKHLSHRLKAFMDWAQESFEKYTEKMRPL